MTPRRPPRAPAAFLAVMVVLAVASIATGVLDVVLPAFVPGLATFGVLDALTRELGPAYLFLHVLVHNLGLACLVPGVGLLAASFERSRANRRLAGALLLGAVVLSLLVAVEYLFQARERFRLALVVPLVLVEAAAVLALAWRGYVVVRAHTPTPRIGWCLVAPARELAPWFAASAVALAAAALVETVVVAGAIA